ncbi:hypothetical protein GCM10027403_26870 [Arthrobacter tecti]
MFSDEHARKEADSIFHALPESEAIRDRARNGRLRPAACVECLAGLSDLYLMLFDPTDERLNRAEQRPAKR